MSAFKPAKQSRLMGQTQVKRTESVDLSLTPGTVEERDRRIASPQPPVAEGETSAMKAPSHPKGHKVRELDEVWKNMDSQSYLHLSDTLTLFDVWVQPKAVEPENNYTANVTFVQMVAAPHIKTREAKCKMSLDDLLKLLYLNDCLQYDIEAQPRLGYDEWIAEKTAAFIKMHGVEEATNRAKLCNFIVSEDESFTFYPTSFHGNCGIFFRKICYHSYKTKEDMGGNKILNPTMVKCCATRGKFEYILEARFFVLPEEWRNSEEETKQDA